MKKFSKLKDDLCVECMLDEATSTKTPQLPQPKIYAKISTGPIGDLTKHHQIKYNKKAFGRLLDVLRDADITVPWNSLSDPVLHIGMFGKFDDSTVNDLEKITYTLGSWDTYASTRIFGSFNQRNDDLTITYIGWLFKNSGTKSMFEKWPLPTKDYDQAIFARTLAHELRHRAFTIISRDPEMIRYMPPELQVGGLWWGSWGAIEYYDINKIRGGGVSAEHAMIYSTDKSKIDPKDPFFDNDLMENYPPDYWRKLYKKVMFGVAAWGLRTLNKGQGTPVPRPTGADVPEYRALPDLTVSEADAREEAKKAASRYIFPKMQTNPVYREMFNRMMKQKSKVGTKFGKTASPTQYIGSTHDAITYILSAANMVTAEMTQILWDIKDDPEPARCKGTSKLDPLKNPNNFYNIVKDARDKLFTEVCIKGNFYKLRDHCISINKLLNTLKHFKSDYIYNNTRRTKFSVVKNIKTSGGRNPCHGAIVGKVNGVIGSVADFNFIGKKGIQPKVHILDEWLTMMFRDFGLQGAKNHQRNFSYTPKTTQNTMEYFSYDTIEKYLRNNPDYDPFDVKFGGSTGFRTTPTPTEKERLAATPPGTIESPSSTVGQPSSVSSGRGMPATAPPEKLGTGSRFTGTRGSRGKRVIPVTAPTVTSRSAKKTNYTWLSRVKSRLNIAFGAKKTNTGSVSPTTTIISTTPLTNEEKSLVEKIKDLIDKIRREKPYLGDNALIAAAVLAVFAGGVFSFRKYLFDRKTQNIASQILRDRTTKGMVQNLRRRERRRVIELLKDPKFRERILAEL